MTVKELIAALSKAHSQDAEVDIIDREGDSIAFTDGFSVDEDGDGNGGEDRMVHIVVDSGAL